MTNLAGAVDAARWAKLNHQYLMAAIAQVGSYLQADDGEVSLPDPPQPPAAIDQLCHLFGLSQFERAIILLCTAIEVGGLSPALIAAAVSTSSPNPTFGLALSRLPQPHWSALTAESPLRRWHLVELGGAPTLTQSPLRINERILHFLLGDHHLDPQLVGIVTTVSPVPQSTLPPSQQQLVTAIVDLLRQTSHPLLIQLCGYDSASKHAIAMAVSAALQAEFLNLTADILPSDFHQLHLIQTLWEREAILRSGLLLLDCDSIPDLLRDGTSGGQPQNNAIARVMETCQQPLFLLSRDRRSTRQRPMFSFEVALPTAIEQRQLWWQTLAGSLSPNGLSMEDVPKVAPLDADHIDKLVSHFSLSPLAIQAVCTQSWSGQLENLPERIWNACLGQARPRLEELAQPIRTQVNWTDLVLPDKEQQTLRTIAAQVRQRMKVYEQWGFANKGQRGLGISALFAGASGTGKTLAAEVLANELRLDLYRIDLSSVVSKYIGETEKNLRRIFDAAEVGGAILLFDEADALFGKRSEVKDSHDRYANMEVAYLLQRMEAYRGLAILTTNLKSSLDQAFLRRLRFVVQFPFPDLAQRMEIWQRAFPHETPIANLSYSKLARLNVPGGNIRNIALNAAFLAADAGVPVQMHHILQSAQSEYIKLERPLTEAEIKGWT